jgi:hypothetical protein
LLPNEDTELGMEEKELLDIYNHSFNDDNIDMDLLMTLLFYIHTSQDKGKSRYKSLNSDRHVAVYDINS